MLPVCNRIITPSDFYKIKKFGKRITSKFFSISFIIDESLEAPQFSVIVSKVIAKKASQRNKIKRITRSLVIKHRARLPKKIKCLIFPKLVVNSTKYQELETEFLKLFSEIK